MITHPTSEQLLHAVMAWLDDSARRQTSTSRDSYMALVARNALGIVLREHQLGAAADARAAARLQTLLHMQGDLAELEQELIQRIRAGAILPDAPSLLDHLRRQTSDRIAIDQPRYRAAQ